MTLILLQLRRQQRQIENKKDPPKITGPSKGREAMLRVHPLWKRERRAIEEMALPQGQVRPAWPRHGQAGLSSPGLA